MTEERLSFQAEVSRLLDIVAHSLYSEKEVFLRELISNASDACDRLRYAALTEPELSAGDPVLGITLSVDKEARTLTVADNGIGMNRADLVANLGTIARSGTGEFMSKLTGDAKKDVGLIGQFGVGFYSAFMVADKVDVFTRRAGEAHSWHWSSDGRGEFTVGEAAGEAGRGTRVVLHLRENDGEYLEEHRLGGIVRNIPTTSRCRSVSPAARRGRTSRPSTRLRRCGSAPSRRSPRSSTRNSTITSATASTIRG